MAEEAALKREKVTLLDNLPKVPADRQIALLRAIYENEPDSKEKVEKYIPIEKQEKYEKNFMLFDRNNDGILDYDQTKQFLISIGQMISEEDLKEFYKQLAKQKETQDGQLEEGVTIHDIYLVVLKRLREQDIEEQLSEAFRIVADWKEKDNTSGFIDSEYFKEMLMTMGFKWGEDQSDEFLKEFEPKAEKRIYPAEVTKKLLKR